MKISGGRARVQCDQTAHLILGSSSLCKSRKIGLPFQRIVCSLLERQLSLDQYHMSETDNAGVLSGERELCVPHFEMARGCHGVMSFTWEALG